MTNKEMKWSKKQLKSIRKTMFKFYHENKIYKKDAGSKANQMFINALLKIYTIAYLLDEKIPEKDSENKSVKYVDEYLNRHDTSCMDDSLVNCLYNIAKEYKGSNKELNTILNAIMYALENDNITTDEDSLTYTDENPRIISTEEFSSKPAYKTIDENKSKGKASLEFNNNLCLNSNEDISSFDIKINNECIIGTASVKHYQDENNRLHLSDSVVKIFDVDKYSYLITDIAKLIMTYFGVNYLVLKFGDIDIKLVDDLFKSSEDDDSIDLTLRNEFNEEGETDIIIEFVKKDTIKPKQGYGVVNSLSIRKGTPHTQKKKFEFPELVSNLTVTQCSQYLKVPINLIYEVIRQNKLKATKQMTKSGKRFEYIVTLTDLLNYVDDIHVINEDINLFNIDKTYGDMLSVEDCANILMCDKVQVRILACIGSLEVLNVKSWKYFTTKENLSNFILKNTKVMKEEK